MYIVDLKPSNTEFSETHYFKQTINLAKISPAHFAFLSFLVQIWTSGDINLGAEFANAGPIRQDVVMVTFFDDIPTAGCSKKRYKRVQNMVNKTMLTIARTILHGCEM